MAHILEDNLSLYPLTRNWQQDYLRLLNSNDESMSNTRRMATNAPTDANHNNDLNTTDFKPMAFGGGARAKAIVQKAFQQLQTAPESTNYYVDANVACASFVSAVLEKASIIAPSHLLNSTARDGDPHRNCNTLPPFLTQSGATRVINGTLPLTEENLKKALIPGDIIFYYRESTHRFGHVEIYIGEGRTIGNSSGQRRVVNRNATQLRGVYSSFTGYRFP